MEMWKSQKKNEVFDCLKNLEFHSHGDGMIQFAVASKSQKIIYENLVLPRRKYWIYR